MTFNHHVSTNPVIGFICWALCGVLNFFIHALEKYQNMQFPEWFMQLGQLMFWCIGGCVGLITIFEWLKKTFPWFKKFVGR